jgi:hypothetical protein
MKKALFLETESGIVVVPKLEDSSWWDRWRYNQWLKKYFKKKVQKSTKRNWKVLSRMFEVRVLIEQGGSYRVENSEAETSYKDVRG